MQRAKLGAGHLEVEPHSWIEPKIIGLQWDLMGYYIYIYIPAKPLSRRRQNCHSSRSNSAPRAGETRFFFFKFKKMHFDLRPPMNLSTSILRGRRSVL